MSLGFVSSTTTYNICYLNKFCFHFAVETERKRSLRSHREPAVTTEASCSVTQTTTPTPNNGIGKLTIKNLGSLGKFRFSITRGSSVITNSVLIR